jgi:hypothetical protein
MEILICPKCRHEQNSENPECPKCGIIFEKYYRHQKAQRNKHHAAPNTDAAADSFLKSIILPAQEATDTLSLLGRGAVLLLIFIWGWTFILSSPGSNAAGNSCMHFINLPFHEAGHIFFKPFGSFIASLGGTLGQLLMPCICLLVLLLKTKDPFGASVALWWLGQNFMDMAPYINDARSLTMPLLGGTTGGSSPYGFHDWEYILTELHLLTYDRSLAALSHGAGTIIMLMSCLWGAAVLVQQYRKTTRTPD